MSYLRDPWLQIFAFLALTSGALAAFGRPGSASAPFAGSGAASAAALDSAPAARVPAPAAAAPAAAAPAAPPALRPKISGKWVVDASLAADADTAKLGDALAAAAAGDVVYLRAGDYKGRFVVRRDITLIGLGARADVVIDGDGAGPSLLVDEASATIKNLTLAHAGTEAGATLEGRRAVLTLSGVEIRAGPLGPGAQDAGLEALGGAASLEDCAITGGHKGVDAHDEAKVALTRTAVTKSMTAVFVQDASVRLSECALTDDARGLTASEQGEAVLSGGEISRAAGALWATRGGRIQASGTRFNLDGAGVLADENGRVELSSAAFFGLSGAALETDSGGEIDDVGSSIARGKSVGATAGARSTLKLDGTRIEDGSGDAVDVAAGATASLKGVRFARNDGAGLSVRNALSVRVEDSDIADETRCAIEVSGAALSLKAARLSGNLCGVAFFGQSVLDADSSRFTDNRRGPFQYTNSRKNEIVVRGENNEPRDLAALIK